MTEVLANLRGNHVFAAARLSLRPLGGGGLTIPSVQFLRRAAPNKPAKNDEKPLYIPTARSLTRSPISLHHSFTFSLSFISGHNAPASVEDKSFFIYALSRFESNFGLLGEGADERDVLDGAAGEERTPVRDMINQKAKALRVRRQLFGQLFKQLGLAFASVWSEPHKG